MNGIIPMTNKATIISIIIVIIIILILIIILITDLGHCGVLPDNELVLRETMGRHNLTVLLVPQQRRHLRLSINGIHTRTGRRVPEANVTVSCASCIENNVSKSESYTLRQWIRTFERSKMTRMKY